MSSLNVATVIIARSKSLGIEVGAHGRGCGSNDDK